MLTRLADLFILQPTTYTIPVKDKVRELFPFQNYQIELWRHVAENSSKDHGDKDTELFILKLPGSGGRAERATEHPAEWWTSVKSNVFSLNLPGYGGSTGRPSLRNLIDASLAAFDVVAQRAGDRPVVITGHSLGGAAALATAARRPVAGVLVRNPPALREVIVGRFGWWNFGVGAGLIARQVPPELDSVQNAATTTAPAVFIMSEQDRVVPPQYQQPIIDAYTGEKCVLKLETADHASPMTQEEQLEYGRLLDWLLEKILHTEKTNDK